MTVLQVNVVSIKRIEQYQKKDSSAAQAKLHNLSRLRQ